MTSARLTRSILGAVVFLLITVLFVKTQALDRDRHSQVVETLRELKQLDSTLNQDILKARFGQLVSYDPLVSSLAELKAQRRNLSAGPSAITGHGQADIDRCIEAYDESLTAKELLLERFKSANAVSRNSLRYFPVAASALAARAGGDRTGGALAAELHALVRDTLIYNLTASEELRPRILAAIDALNALRGRVPAGTAAAIDNIVAHARIIVAAKGEVDALVAQLMAVPTARRADQVYRDYSAYHAQSARRANVYRFYLYLISVLSLSYVAYVMLQLQRSNAELRRRATEQRSLVEAGRLLASTLDLREVLDRLAEITRSLLGVDIVRLGLRDDRGEALIVHALAGAARTDPTPPDPFAPETELADRVAAQGRPVILGDVQGDPTLKKRPWVGAEGIRSLLALPLVLDDTSVGILACMSRTRREWSSDEVMLAQTLATAASVAIRNAQLYEGVQARIGQMRQLTEISHAVSASLDLQQVLDCVTKAALDLVKGDAAQLWVVDEESPRLRLAAFTGVCGDGSDLPTGAELPLGQDLSDSRGPLDDSRQVATRPAAADGCRSRVAVPLRIGERTLGALVVMTRAARRFRQDEEEMLDLFAVKAATALENARLYQRVQRAYDELSQTQDQLTQAQKMEAIGRLAGGIAHDFNNLLTVINGRSQLLLNRLESGNRLRSDIELIQKTGNRAATLTHQLLAFSRRQVLQPKVLALNAVVTGLEPMLRRLIGEDIDLVVVPRLGVGLVKADPGQLEQVILNLVVNARDAMPSGGQLTLETMNVEPGETSVVRDGDVPPGRYVMLAVSDTGCGIDPKTRARIFEPFFTTKERGKGTGLGLATVYGIVKQHNGYISLESEPGRGTTFNIYLPRAEDPAEALDVPVSPAGPPRGAETVLLVEDEAEVRSFAREVLCLNGYTVLEAADGIDALGISERYPKPIHLVLADVVMPRMGGRELIRRLAAAHREMRVVYMSGYTEDALNHKGVLDPGTVLQKPFSPDALARMVRAALDAPPAGGPALALTAL